MILFLLMLSKRLEILLNISVSPIKLLGIHISKTVEKMVSEIYSSNLKLFLKGFKMPHQTGNKTELFIFSIKVNLSNRRAILKNGKCNTEKGGGGVGMISEPVFDILDKNQFNSLDKNGMVYIPDSCKTGNACKVHVALHGCVMGMN